MTWCMQTNLQAQPWVTEIYTGQVACTFSHAQETLLRIRIGKPTMYALPQTYRPVSCVAPTQARPAVSCAPTCLMRAAPCADCCPVLCSTHVSTLRTCLGHAALCCGYEARRPRHPRRDVPTGRITLDHNFFCRHPIHSATFLNNVILWKVLRPLHGYTPRPPQHF